MKLFRKLIALSLALLLLLGIVACGKGNENTPGESTTDPATSEPPLDYTTTNPTAPQAPSQSGDANGAETTPPPVINEEVQGLTAQELVKHNAEAIASLLRYEIAMTEELTVAEGRSYSHRVTSKRTVDCDDDSYQSDISLFRYFQTALTTERYGEGDPAIDRLDQITIFHNNVYSAQGTAKTPWKIKTKLDPAQYDPIYLAAKKDIFTEDLTLYFSSLTKTDLPQGGYSVAFDGVKSDRVASILYSFHTALEEGILLSPSAVLTPTILKGVATYDVNGILTRVEMQTAFTVPYESGELTVAATSVRAYNFSGTVTPVELPADKDSYREESNEPIVGMRLTSVQLGESVTLTDTEYATLTTLFATLPWSANTVEDYVIAYQLDTANEMYAITDNGWLVNIVTGHYLDLTEENRPTLNTVYEIIEDYFPEDSEENPEADGEEV